MLESNQIDIFVAPMLISRESQLAGVDDVFNGIMVRGDATGDVVFYGKGAGKLPTASAVVADVIDCIKHINARKYLYWSDSEDGYVINYKDSITAMYIRAEVQSSDEGFDKAREIFGNIKPLSRNNVPQNEIAFVTEEKTFGELLDGIDKFSSNGIQVLSRIRIGDL